MLVGQRNIATSDTRRFRISYKDWLIKGAIISAVSVTVPSGTTSTVGGGSLAPTTEVDKDGIIFYIVAGAVKETFIVSIQVTDSLSQVVNDTLSIQVIGP